jgi:DNA (cytosine-5)-methyltransferase 1
MSRRKILVADLLCGAGGSSTGCARALADLGLEMELVCVNHWPVAIATHQRNHPQARHYCQDIAAVRPHQIVPEGYLDLLMASPSCTHHSVARGGKPTSDQQRSDPWHIVTWFTELRVKRAIIENVWEFTGWGPVDVRTARPVKSRRGEYFNAWVDAIRRVGATSIEYRKLNAANYGDATTRQRFIMKIRFDKVAVGWAPLTHARAADDLLLFPGLKPWRPAREIIDWSIKGKSIFDRKKPLAAKTLARIYAGAVKFNWSEPYLVRLRNHATAQGLDLPLPTLTAGGTHLALAQPFVMAPGSTGAPRELTEPLPTVTTGGAGSKRPGCARPMLIEGRASGPALISPYYGSGSGETCQSAEQPLPTVTSKARFGMVVPITHSDRSNRARDVEVDPLPTLTTANRGELAFITAQFGEREGQAPRVHDISQPTPAICATGHVNLAQATPHCDILFRMLEPHELAAAMGFDGDDTAYEFTGTKTERVKQIGNAVSVAMMRAEVKAIMADAISTAAAGGHASRRPGRAPSSGRGDGARLSGGAA